MARVVDYGILLYQFVTLLAGFGAQAYVLALHGQSSSPLSLRYLRFSLPFTLFYLLISFSATVFRTDTSPSPEMEVLASALFFVLYASMVSPWAAFVLELLQRPYSGAARRLAIILASLGPVAALVLMLWPLGVEERQQGLRLILQGIYLPMVLLFLVAMVVLLWRRIATLTDRWKQSTGRGIVLLVASSLPLFVLDGLWPWLQLQEHWVPRGFNFHGLFFAGFNLFLAYRWSKKPPDGLGPLEPSRPVRRADPIRLRSLSLTFREEEVLRLVFEFRSNQEIADLLELSLGTVKNHIYHIFQKSGASSRRELIEMLTP